MILLLLASISLADSVEKEIPPKDFKWGLSVYGGLLFQDSLDEITKGTPRVREHSYILVTALTRELWRFRDWFGFELEGQIVRHFDEMNHWEFNGLLAARWRLFPWDKYLDTSFAIGDGISYATEVPEIEEKKEADSGKWLNYLMFELTFGEPKPRNGMFYFAFTIVQVYGGILVPVMPDQTSFVQESDTISE